MNKEECFNIPVVLFFFKRRKAVDIMKKISAIKPTKVYLLGDQGRDDNERLEVEECRRLVEEVIGWDCEVIKNYAIENRGVYENIGLGAKWVFEQEEQAIFLEDDNLPEVTFFEYCKQMLEIYKNDTRIFWICGTNYLGEYDAEDGSSYMFTKHLLPCGWASWSEKFNKFYDPNLSLVADNITLKKVEREYQNRKLFLQYKACWSEEYLKFLNGNKPSSWDYHLDFALKANSLYGISPCRNQIKNIGVDLYSAHGGTTFSNEMTNRFCGMESYPLGFPLKHPVSLLPDTIYEKKIAELLLFPLSYRIKYKILRFVRRILNIPENLTTKQYIKEFHFLKKL